jgi:predicted RNase H-like nuclease
VNTTLLVGFDSAWAAHNSGALAGALRSDDATFHELGLPIVADFADAEWVVKDWQAE